MSLTTEVWELVRAGFSGIWIQTHEPSEALLELATLGREQQLRVVHWNLDTGLRSIQGEELTAEASDPLSALRALTHIGGEQPSLLLLENFHRFVDSAEICQAMLTQLQLGKQLGRHLLVLSPLVKLPQELERQFVVLQHALPDREQLWEIAQSLIDDPDSYGAAEQSRLLDSAAGLTRLEAESAYSLSLVRHGRLTSEEIWQLKAGWLQKSGMLRLHRGETGFDGLGGLDNLKQFCQHSLRGRESSKARPRGVMLLGVPGTGKSAFAKALGKETGRPVLMLDVGQLMGSLVGQTEANIRSALQTADALAPSILFIDEVEKALSGVAGGGKGDSGVASRLFGTLLTWLNDHTSQVYVVVTCNNIQQLPPEFSRAERFDAIMFLDLPGEQEKAAIWELYLNQYGLDSQQTGPPDDHWTGAEIKACCRLASLLGIGLQEAAQYIVPVGVTAAEDIQRLRTWASGRCLDASRPGIFRHPAAGSPAGTPKRPPRGLRLGPSEN
jgi:hypothetical protein